jgi:hypothetical protein
MPRVRFEPTKPVFERAKTVHALHRAATVISTDAAWKCSNISRASNTNADLASENDYGHARHCSADGCGSCHLKETESVNWHD